MDDLNNTANTNNTATNSAHDAATNQGRAERDEKGRFSKGNRGGAGNPFARQTAKLRQAALDAVSEDDVRDIISALKDKAKAGDVAASKLLLSYSMGKPELFQSKMQTAKEVLSAPPAEEDDDDDLELVDDAEDAASGPENVAAAEACAGNDNIPAWMYEMVNANRAVPPAAVAEKPQRCPHKGAEQEAALLLKQLLDLVNEGKMRRSSAAEQEVGRGRCLDGEL